MRILCRKYMRGLPRPVKGDGLRGHFRRDSWVQIPSLAPLFWGYIYIPCTAGLPATSARLITVSAEMRAPVEPLLTWRQVMFERPMQGASHPVVILDSVRARGPRARSKAVIQDRSYCRPDMGPCMCPTLQPGRVITTRPASGRVSTRVTNSLTLFMTGSRSLLSYQWTSCGTRSGYDPAGECGCRAPG